LQFCNLFVIITLVIITKCNFLKAVTVIFKDLIKEKLDKAFKFVKGNRILVKFTSFALVAVLSLVVSIVACGITFGFNVNYSGKNIAVVSKTSVFDKAREIVLEHVEDKSTADAIENPKFAFTITILDKLDSEKTVADAIIENTDEISCGFAVKVNGEVLTYTDAEKIDEYVESVRCRFFIEGAENTASFVDEVVVEEGYYLDSKIEDEQAAKAKIDALQVKTVSVVTSEIEVPFSTKTNNRADQYIGYSRLVKSGQNGVNRVVENVETVNGAQTARVVVSNEVIKAPVAQIVEKGTKIQYASATEKAAAKGAGLIYPMNRSDVKKITAYWGDGRGHKGIDLAGDTGSPIFASKGGTVIFAGWDGNYGYAIVIDHGDGLKTRYAHNSALCVKKGATVTQGQQIAKLGNTGRSTGPHLHFEILKNDKQVNPTAYIKF